MGFDCLHHPQPDGGWLVLILGIVHFFAARQWGEAEADRLSDRALLAIGPVLVLGTIASLFHLGNR